MQKPPTQQEIDNAINEVNKMDHFSMCYLWRMHPIHEWSIYFDSTYPVAEVFKERLFTHFGGFTSEISKEIGFKR